MIPAHHHCLTTCGPTPASGGRTVATYIRSSGADPDARFTFGVHTPGTGDCPPAPILHVR
ncbi:MAG: hypothetical protein LC792_12335 [Actinobacteria bacterium]|nr:hypothetical protein [Actinomycetota bacterium]